MMFGSMCQPILQLSAGVFLEPLLVDKDIVQPFLHPGDIEDQSVVGVGLFDIGDQLSGYPLAPVLLVHTQLAEVDLAQAVLVDADVADYDRGEFDCKEDPIAFQEVVLGEAGEDQLC